MFVFLRTLFVAMIVLPLLSKVGRIAFSVFILALLGFFVLDWLAQGGINETP